MYRFIVTAEFCIPGSGKGYDQIELVESVQSCLDRQRFPFLCGKGMERGQARVLTAVNLGEIKI